MKTFVQTLDSGAFDPALLAMSLGVDESEVQRWREADQVPEHMVAAAAETLGVPGFAPPGFAPPGGADESKPAAPRSRKKSRPKRASRSKTSRMSKAAVDAVTTCAELAYMDKAQREMLLSVLDIDMTDGEGPSTLVDLTTKVMSPSKSVQTALGKIIEVRAEDSEVRATLMLGAIDLSTLRDMHRIASAATGADYELPGSKIDAAIVVRDALKAIDEHDSGEDFAWLCELLG